MAVAASGDAVGGGSGREGKQAEHTALTSSAMAMVMSTADTAIPIRPIRCSDLRPARSTTNSYKRRVERGG